MAILINLLIKWYRRKQKERNYMVQTKVTINGTRYAIQKHSVKAHSKLEAQQMALQITRQHIHVTIHSTECR